MNLRFDKRSSRGLDAFASWTWSHAINDAPEPNNINSNRRRQPHLPAITARTVFQRPLFAGRNTLRAPATSELNLRYSRIFPIKERWKPEFFFESTNIFNHTNVTGINATASVDTLGAIITPASLAWTSALEQRLIQFGLKLMF